jgi:hypothetical protein
MKAYVIIYENIKTKFKTVSQEAYFKLEEAQEFCLNRDGNVQQINDFLFVDEAETCGYEIKEISIK